MCEFELFDYMDKVRRVGAEHGPGAASACFHFLRKESVEKSQTAEKSGGEGES